MLDPKQMHAFTVLAEHMHFGKTAKILGISQSTLSTQIRSLEEEIGGALINRSNRTMKLTVLGETFLTDAKNILALMECAKKNSSDILDGTVSSLRLGVDCGTVTSRIFDQILAEAHRRFPKLELSTMDNPPVSLLKELSAGRLDVVISNTFGLDIPKNVVSYTLANWKPMLVVSEKYQVTKANGELDIAAVSELPFIIFEHIDESPRVIEHIFSFRPKRIFRLPSVPLIASYVEQGMGAAIVPDADLSLFHPHTKVYPIPNGVMPVKMMRLNSSNSPTMIRFFRMLRELFLENKEAQ